MTVQIFLNRSNIRTIRAIISVQTETMMMPSRTMYPPSLVLLTDGGEGDDGGGGAMAKVAVEAVAGDDGVDEVNVTRNELVGSKRFAGLHSLSSCACG